MKELRMAIFVGLLNIIIKFVPKEAIKTWLWLRDMPWEDFKN